jgi:O-antigen/teichoic acid export membrane protein
MFRFALSTFGAKIATSLVNFILIVIASHYIGAAGVGEISMILLTVSVVVMASFIIGGSAIVYLTPRYPVLPIMVVTYLWSLIITAITFFVLKNVEIIEQQYVTSVVILSFLASMFSVHFNILLGKEKIHKVNILSVANVLIILAIFSYFVFFAKGEGVWAYIYGMFVAYVTIYLWSLMYLMPYFREGFGNSGKKLLKDLLHYGVLLQLANIALLFNYRGGYYFVEHFYNKASLGVYSVGNQLTEASWMISRSFSTVLYARVSNIKEDEGYLQTKYYVLSFFKIVFIITLAILFILLIMPRSVYEFVYGSEFYEVKDIIWALSPGILLFSVSRILAVFFSGTGRALHFSLGTFVSLLFL